MTREGNIMFLEIFPPQVLVREFRGGQALFDASRRRARRARRFGQPVSSVDFAKRDARNELHETAKEVKDMETKTDDVTPSGSGPGGVERGIREDRAHRALYKRGQALRIGRRGAGHVRALYHVIDCTTDLTVPGGEGLTLEQVEVFADIRRDASEVES